MKIVSGVWLAIVFTAAAAAADCRLDDIAGGTVSAVRDGRTIVLADSREIRLACIEAPAESADALGALVRGRTLRLKQPHGGGEDRYGRAAAFAYLPDTGDRSIQQALLAAGALPLLAAEREAREARRGLWPQAAFAPIDADSLAAIASAQGKFALIEGKVLSVREAGATIYVNFGRRWSRDFTTAILRRNQRLFSAAGIELKSLAGRHIRVRGVVERRGGPIIEAETPEQIEIIQ